MDKQFQNSPKTLSKDEEADEIMRRLATPPKPKTQRIEASWTLDNTIYDNSVFVDDNLYEALSASIAAEIDKEFMDELKKWMIIKNR